MKTTMLLIALSLFSLIACKKEAASINNPASSVNVIPASVVPQAVLSAFNISFSTATETEWQHNSNDSFECQFNMDGQRHEAHFDDKGNESSHSVICIDAPVPSVVLDAFRKAYATDNVYEWKLTNEGTWKAHFMRSSVKWEVTFSSTGTVVKEEHN